MVSKDTKRAFASNVLLLGMIMVLFIFSYNVGLLNNLKVVQLLMQTIILASITCCALIDKKNNEKYFKMVYLILFLGIVMRIGYMLYTPVNVRSHDAGMMGIDQYGHFSYIHRIYVTHRLPDTNLGQLYHPPLFHILSAIMMRLVKVFVTDHEVSRLIEAAKIVSCFASCATLRITYLICKELELDSKYTCITTAFIAFLPNMYLLSGRINNDSLVIYFMFVIILYTFRWCKNRCYRNTMVLALAFGLGMSTKISCGIFAVFTGTIMLIVLVKEIRNGKVSNIIKKLLCFGVISFPLGLWYPIRNYILYKQPFNYVLKISIENKIYCGDRGIFERFIQIPVKSLFENLYNRPFEDYNIHMYSLKGALFGEFSFKIHDFIPILLLVLYLFIMMISMLGMLLAIIRVIKSIRNKTIKESTINHIVILIGMPAIWLIMMVSYISFNVRYPFGCTMDYRYIVPVALVNAMTYGYFYHIADVETNKTSNVLYQKFGSVFLSFVKILTILFAVFSMVMFCNISI